MKIKKIIEKLYTYNDINNNELLLLLQNFQNIDLNFLKEKASIIQKKYYKNVIYARGLIEISNYCQQNCYYCGIRKNNQTIKRYRLSTKEILDSCKKGYNLGLRTFVIQGGEDPYWQNNNMTNLIKIIKKQYPDIIITLSLGELSKKKYQIFYNAGANRYLLRHESINSKHYQQLHPVNQTIAARTKCLTYLKKIGYQTGCGIMIGSPYQTFKNIVEDLRFMKQFQPAMIGIGPFISTKNTPFSEYPNGNIKLTLILLSIIRLMNPKVLLPSTTALSTLNLDVLQGILYGANVIMINISPDIAKENYNIYENKNKCLDRKIEFFKIKRELKIFGYELSGAIGNPKK